MRRVGFREEACVVAQGISRIGTQVQQVNLRSGLFRRKGRRRTCCQPSAIQPGTQYVQRYAGRVVVLVAWLWW